ncbi:hypothetical protein [Nonomuraea longicatena]|uniref:Uncharacterized protein n=1 Tax=Nonomuraea longicatena TaxID=83682 RepID=A0ABN1PWT2_9ACTN
MRRLWCQVCGSPAADPNGRIPWILTETAIRWDPGWPGVAITNAPPTCRTCIPGSLAACPQLHKSADVYTASAAAPAGVLGDVHEPTPSGLMLPAGMHEVEVRFDNHRYLPSVLAHSLLVRVFDLQPAI